VHRPVGQVRDLTGTSGHEHEVGAGHVGGRGFRDELHADVIAHRTAPMKTISAPGSRLSTVERGEPVEQQNGDLR
jgi:hypothetical protein